MYVNDKDFNKERELEELEEKAFEQIEQITKIKAVPFGNKKGRRANRLKILFHACNNLIELDIKNKVNFYDDVKSVDVIIKMMNKIIKYFEANKNE